MIRARKRRRRRKRQKSKIALTKILPDFKFIFERFPIYEKKGIGNMKKIKYYHSPFTFLQFFLIIFVWIKKTLLF